MTRRLLLPAASKRPGQEAYLVATVRVQDKTRRPGRLVHLINVPRAEPFSPSPLPSSQSNPSLVVPHSALRSSACSHLPTPVPTDASSVIPPPLSPCQEQWSLNTTVRYIPRGLLNGQSSIPPGTRLQSTAGAQRRLFSPPGIPKISISQSGGPIAVGMILRHWPAVMLDLSHSISPEAQQPQLRRFLSRGSGFQDFSIRDL